LEDDKGGEGGFGIVWTVKIHASAQKLVSSSLETVVIARKELRETDSSNERTILELLRHPNIVRVFGSYTHHGVHNLRFPYVSMNLEGLFQQMSIIDSHVSFQEYTAYLTHLAKSTISALSTTTSRSRASGTTPT
jgi:serine/threonine protein kinase